jgi:hypothetical protein
MVSYILTDILEDTSVSSLTMEPVTSSKILQVCKGAK